MSDNEALIKYYEGLEKEKQRDVATIQRLMQRVNELEVARPRRSYRGVYIMSVALFLKIVEYIVFKGTTYQDSVMITRMLVDSVTTIGIYISVMIGVYDLLEHREVRMSRSKW